MNILIDKTSGVVLNCSHLNIYAENGIWRTREHYLGVKESVADLVSVDALEVFPGVHTYIDGVLGVTSQEDYEARVANELYLKQNPPKAKPE